MRPFALAAALIVTLPAPAQAQMTALERERLVAHLEMTKGWLEDELSNLSPVQLQFRRAAGTWNILEVLEHVVLVGPIYWEDLQRAVKGPPKSGTLASSDTAILWYGINRTTREAAVPTETPAGQLRDAAAGLAGYRKNHARLLQYVRTTEDDLRNRVVDRQGSDAYQWALLISTHEQRHILQIREIKADPRFPR
jgi:hypothetical protein